MNIHNRVLLVCVDSFKRLQCLYTYLSLTIEIQISPVNKILIARRIYR